MSVYDAFAPIYDDWSADMTEDVPFYVELARESEGPLVELAVGNGRVAIPVARETGRPVLGIDSSPAMLAQARERADAAGVELELREGDMRDLELDEPAGPDLRPVPRACSTCRPGPTGGASSSASTPRCGPVAASPGTHSSSTRASPRASTASGRSRTASATGSTRSKHDNRIDITLESGDAISLWWLTKSEWEGLIDVAGFEVEALYGGFERQPFDETANEFVWVVRKPV